MGADGSQADQWMKQVQTLDVQRTSTQQMVALCRKFFSIVLCYRLTQFTHIYNGHGLNVRT